MRKRWAMIACIAVLASASFVSARPGGPSGSGETAPAAAEAQRSISIRGNVENLYPGRSARFRLRLHNRTMQRLVITSIRAKVADASAGCAAENLRVEDRRLRRGIPPRSTRRAGIDVLMVAGAPDACQGERFPLDYTARARR